MATANIAAPSAITTESTPLLSRTTSDAAVASPARPPKPPRTVTFNPNPVTKTISPEPNYRRSRNYQQQHVSNPTPPSFQHSGYSTGSGSGSGSSAISTGGLGGGPPMLSALNNKLRRRNSHGGNSSVSHNAGAGAPLIGGNNGAAGSSLLPLSSTTAGGAHQPKIGPQRSTKNAQKLKLLPNPEFGEDGPDEESGRDVYSQYTRIKDPTARRDAARLGKADRARLPRVTAYCTANRYQMEGLMRFLKGRGKLRGANPKLIDECIYTPYSYTPPHKQVDTNSYRQNHHNTVGGHELKHHPLPPPPPNNYQPERRHSTGEVDAGESGFNREDLIDLGSDGATLSSAVGMATGANGYEQYHEVGTDLDMLDQDRNLNRHSNSNSNAMIDEREDQEQQEQEVDNLADFDTHVHTPEVFLFEYGVVVIWGMSAAHEQRFLKEIAKFETEKLAPDDVEAEYFNFYYTHEYQARIYNDFITLRDKNNYMTKLAISHALAQSVKTSLFEELIASTIDTCKDIPTQIALTGKIALSRTQINMQIGELFILRINIHLNGSVLDTPELFWVEPQLEPVYQAVRSYLEMDQRVGLLTERLDVIADLLAVLKDQLSHGHGEKLEWIVIVLIAAEILVAAVNIVVDLYAGVD
ncbi:putative sporulation protein rmd1 protein [Diplogelasinospora grovesii]|uniref:Sporulation protein rmd1 protein n=1 Tax=Diplogelasinospora grovesii TaxID=303347 RepID=A0AAN6N4H3_9PEZI|nr:putative sporulation protein rmd1 protein [Diplogelasinospora grovesii]